MDAPPNSSLDNIGVYNTDHHSKPIADARSGVSGTATVSRSTLSVIQMSFFPLQSVIAVTVAFKSPVPITE